uniref:AIG1-type G domain-containing protein n=1 Tax=Sinocyclocheilus anshuiensis TaxID=1608454 RepID=A0A671L420_9TELE
KCVLSLLIVLLGYRRAGKSSTGNSILGREEFDLKRSAQCVRRHGEVADRHITVIEAPGWWRNYTVEKSPEILKLEIVLSVSQCPSGPHAILLIIRVDDKFKETERKEIVLSVSQCPSGPHAVLLIIRVDTRFKETERKALQGHLDLLGERVWSHTIVLFTRGDSLLDTSIEQHIESEGQDLQWLLDKCGNRYHVLNNQNRISKPKRYSLSKLRLCHVPLKRLVLTRPHISTSLCGNICIMPPKCARKERRRGFSNAVSVEAAMSGRRCVILGESKSTLFGLPKVDAFRNL